MTQRLVTWLAQVAYLDEAEAAEVLYAIFREWFEDARQAHTLTSAASITQVRLLPDGPRRLQAAWNSPESEPPSAEGEPQVEHQALGWLLTEILLRKPFSPRERFDLKPAQVIKLINARWQHDFGREIKPELAEFVSRHLLSDGQADLEALEMELRLLTQHCAKALPEAPVGWLIETLVGLIGIAPLQPVMRNIGRLIFVRAEGRRHIQYLDGQRRSKRLALYARALVYVALLVLAANIPGCMRQLDQQVRHSWFLWRGEQALPDDLSLVLLDGWDGTAFDRERLVGALDAVLTYQPQAVAVDVFLQAEYAEIDQQLKGILTTHPEVVIVGEHTPYGLRPPPDEITGIDYSPAHDAEGRVASDLIRFPTPWWQYGGGDDYVVSYHQGQEQRVSLAELLALRGSHQVEAPAVILVNYLGEYAWLRKQPPVVPAELLYRADDATDVALLMQDTLRSALQNKLVLIGVDATDQDRHNSPFDKLAPPANGIPGVVVHYFAACTLLNPRLRLIRGDAWAWPLCLLVFLTIALMSRRIQWFHPTLPWISLVAHYFVSLAAFLWLRLYLPWLPVLGVIVLTYPVICLVVAADHLQYVRKICTAKSQASLY